MSQVTDGPIELVIFDCDGVLVDSTSIVNQAMSEIFNSFGWQLSPDEAGAQVHGKTNDAILEMIETETNQTLDIDLQKLFAHHAYKAFENDLLPIPGVLTVLNELPIAYCAATNAVREEAELKLRVTGLLPWFSNRLFCSDDVANGKPAPDLFLKAAAEMRVEPERVLVVEDSVTGIQAATAANMAVAGLAKNEALAKQLANAGAFIIADIREVLDLVN